MDSIKVTRKQIAPIIAATFPEYAGRKFRVEFRDAITFHNTNWGDGSRNEYTAVNANGRTGRYNAPAPWVNPVEGKSVKLAADVLIVMHSIFCGQDMGITIYAHPSLAPKLLAA